MTPRTSSGRWLAGITVSVVVLAIIAVVVTLVAGSGDPPELPDGSPEAVVQDFILAVDNGEYQAAYELLHPFVRTNCPISEFRRYIEPGRDSEFRVSLRSVEEVGNEAHVTVDVTSFYGNPPFDFSESTQTSTFVLVQEDGAWLISEAPPWPFSNCPYYPERLPTSTPTPTPTPATSVTPATES
jgi:hypothetical protein